MPLKHLTETMLVVALAIVCIVTGVLLAALPPLPQGILPWLIVLVLSLAYPLGLYPLLKRNRADYAFRFLHFLPAILVVLWLLLRLLSLKFTAAQFLTPIYLFGWSLLGVTVSFVLLALFCISVIRRRVPRLLSLLVLFVPFVALSLWSEGALHGREKLTAMLWSGSWWDVTTPRGTSGGSASSSHPTVIALVPPKSGQTGALAGLIVSSRRSQPPLFQTTSSSSRPTRLPSAGPEVDGLLVTLGALYAATLHWRAKNRIQQR